MGKQLTEKQRHRRGLAFVLTCHALIYTYAGWLFSDWLT